MFLSNFDPESDSRIIKVPNSPKRVKNQSGRAREKSKHEHDEIKLSQLTSRLSNHYLWMIQYELFWQLPWIFLTK